MQPSLYNKPIAMKRIAKSPIQKLKSVDDAPVIRKFSVFFSLMSFFPFIVLAILFFLSVSTGTIKISSTLFFWAVFLIGIFALIGFISMRQTFINLTRVSKDAQNILKGDLTRRIHIKTGGDNEVNQLAHSFNEIVRQLEDNIKQLEKSRKIVQDILLKIASGVSFAENIDTFLELILNTTVDALGAKTGLLLMLDTEKNELVVRSAYNLDPGYEKGRRIPVEEEVAGWVIKHKKPLFIPRLHKASTTAAFELPLIAAPLVFHNTVLGVILLSGKKEGNNFEEDELAILSNISAQVALALENARLNADNEKAYFETISALAMAVEARDVYSRGHSDRIGEYSVKIARELQLPEQRIKAIQEAAQLHDVGKIGISDEILLKAGMLNDTERQIIEQHPVIGEGIIIPLHGFSHLRDAIRHHHEWLNGQGYPDHLKGDQISLEAKILAVTDCFDAMTTDRPYQKAKDFAQAKEELLRHVGERYEKKVVDALIKTMNL
jgi:HD-GYP domain-containing protein (c-di-GMP phosphodiesterase class II)/HAMP domain-containing protein